MNMQVNTSTSTFRRLLEDVNTKYKPGTRNVVIEDSDLGGIFKQASLAKAGRCSLTSAAKELNRATMQSFKAALINEHGEIGENAFKRVIGGRGNSGRPLHLRDVRRVLDKVAKNEMRAFIKEGNNGKAPLAPRLLTKSGVAKMNSALLDGMRKSLGKLMEYEEVQFDRLPTNRALSARRGGEFIGRVLESNISSVEVTLNAAMNNFFDDPSTAFDDGRPTPEIPEGYQAGIREYVRDNLLATIAGTKARSGGELAVPMHMIDCIHTLQQEALDNLESFAPETPEQAAARAAQERADRQAEAQKIMQRMTQITDALNTIFG